MNATPRMQDAGAVCGRPQRMCEMINSVLADCSTASSASAFMLTFTFSTRVKLEGKFGFTTGLLYDGTIWHSSFSFEGQEILERCVLDTVGLHLRCIMFAVGSRD